MEWFLTLPGLITVYIVLVNLFAFLQMGWDKRQSKRPEARRVPEKRLFMTAALGGSLGAVLGLFRFRHKTKHWKFRLGLPLILVGHVVLAGFLWYQLG